VIQLRQLAADFHYVAPPPRSAGREFAAGLWAALETDDASHKLIVEREPSHMQVFAMDEIQRLSMHHAPDASRSADISPLTALTTM
jgi:hypothetical protein